MSRKLGICFALAADEDHNMQTTGQIDFLAHFSFRVVSLCFHLSNLNLRVKGSVVVEVVCDVVRIYLYLG